MSYSLLTPYESPGYWLADYTRNGLEALVPLTHRAMHALTWLDEKWFSVPELV